MRAKRIKIGHLIIQWSKGWIDKEDIGYLVNKYYEEFKKDDNYKEVLELWKPEPSANVNAKKEF
ncbi:hypothetical protein [Lactovum odontotermitis]